MLLEILKQFVLSIAIRHSLTGSAVTAIQRQLQIGRLDGHQVKNDRIVEAI